MMIMNEVDVIESPITRWPRVADFLSVPRTEAEYDRAVTLLNELVDTVGEQESHPLAELMETLATLMEVYENQHYPVPEVSMADKLAFLMEEHRVAPTELQEELGNEVVVEEILNGHRPLTVSQSLALSKRFSVSPAVFRPVNYLT